MTQFKEFQKQAFPKEQVEEPEELKKLRLKQEKHQENQERLRLAVRQYDPSKDPHIKGDPKRTLFIGRLSYEVDEVELQKEFLKFGEIEKVRIVRDKTTDKSRGYAFIVFAEPISKIQAYKEANGMTIKGRKIITDHEKSRTEYDWLPRRLGGGLGGRGYIKREALKEREYNDMKKRVESAANRGAGPIRRQGGFNRNDNRNGSGGFRGSSGYDHNRSSSRYNNSSSNNGYQSTTPTSSSNYYNQRQQRYPSQSQGQTPQKQYTPSAQPYSTPSSTNSNSNPTFEYSSRSRREGGNNHRMEPLPYGAPGSFNSRKIEDMKEKIKSKRPEPMSY